MTLAYALIDRKTKKVIWIGLEKPKHQGGTYFKQFGPRLWTLEYCDCINYEKHALIPVTISPVKRGKKKR